MMSDRTSGSSEYSRYSFSGPEAAARNASFTSDAVVGRLTTAVKSVNETVGCGNPDGKAVEPAHQFRYDLPHRGGSPRGCRDHVDAGPAGPAQVLVGLIEHMLVVGVRVNGIHRSTGNAEAFV